MRNETVQMLRMNLLYYLVNIRQQFQQVGQIYVKYLSETCEYILVAEITFLVKYKVQIVKLSIVVPFCQLWQVGMYQKFYSAQTLFSK